jgi:hypothetical protein
VGDGSSIFLCHVHWHPASYLLERYGYRAIYDSGHLRLQDSPLLSRVRTGFGRGLDQMIWLTSKAGYLKLLLEILICPFGSLASVLTHVLTLGINLGKSFWKLLGEGWFGSLWLFLSIISFAGLCLEILSLQNRSCLIRVLVVI